MIEQGKKRKYLVAFGNKRTVVEAKTPKKAKVEVWNIFKFAGEVEILKTL